MRHSCSSCVKGLVTVKSTPISRGSEEYTRPPWAFMTMLSQASRKRRPWRFFPGDHDAYAHENARAAAILSVADGGHGAAIVRHPGSARQSLAAQVFPSGHSGGPLLDSTSDADPPRRADSHCACGNSLGLLE